MAAEQVPDDRIVVLVADDRAEMADLYAAWLHDRFDVRNSRGRPPTADDLDDVDVLLLDRRLLASTDEDVVATIRASESDPVICLLTSDEPSAPLVRLPVDEFATTPISQRGLRRLVERLHGRTRLSDPKRTAAATLSKLILLDTSEADRSSHDEFRTLCERLDSLAERAAFDDASASTNRVIRSLRELPPDSVAETYAERLFDVGDSTEESP